MVEEEAKKIADIILNTETEERGELFLKIAMELEKETQYFTANCIRLAAERYGYDR